MREAAEKVVLFGVEDEAGGLHQTDGEVVAEVAPPGPVAGPFASAAAELAGAPVDQDPGEVNLVEKGFGKL